MDATTMTTAYQPAVVKFIPETALEALDKRLAQVNRQATKLGVEGLRYELTGREEHRKASEFPFSGLSIKRTNRFVEVAVYGAQPRLPGDWTLLGVIDHREALPVTKAVPGQELPAGQRERGPVCDHCGAARRRVGTFVLRAVDGRAVQVGRQCLGDFLGLSVNDPARQLSWWQRVSELLDGDDFILGEGGLGRAREMIEVEAVTLVSAACVDHYGWVSRARAQASNNEEATASKVSFLLWPPHKMSPGVAREWHALKDAVELRATDALKVEVKDALQWACNQAQSTSDYLLNLAACALSGRVGSDKLGLVCSLIAAYRREQDRLKEAERKQREGAGSVFIGEVKQRLVLDLTLTERPRAYENAYGVTYRCEFSDASGNLFVWWASNDPTLETTMGWNVGDVKRVKGTVKKHEDYKGIKRTAITRVAAV